VNEPMKIVAMPLRVLFTATKNADQPLAVWRMIQKLAYITCSTADRAKSTAVGLVVRCVVAVSAYITVLSLL